MEQFHYVYLLVSEQDASKRYTGLTSDLDDRLKSHNAGENRHTRKFIPWRLETVIAFRSRKKAASFEQYLKSHSGRAFAKKRL